MSKNQPTKILVLGHRGFLGRHVINELRGVDCEDTPIMVCGVDRVEQKWKFPPGSCKYDMKAHINGALGNHLEFFRPHVVINCAGQADAGLCQADPDRSWWDNVFVTQVAISIALQYECSRLVTASSAAVYTDTASVYARDKMVAEWQAMNTKVPTVFAMRLFNLYGPGANHGVIARWAKSYARGERVRLEGSGRQTRDFIHVVDAARAMIQGAIGVLSEEPIRIAFDIGTGVETSLNQVRELMGIPEEQMIHAPAGYGPDGSVANPKHAKNYIDFEATQTVESNIPLQIDFARKNL